MWHGMLFTRLSHWAWVTLYHCWCKIKSPQLCLMACDHPSFSWSHSKGFQWGSGLKIGLNVTGSWLCGPSFTHWLSWLCIICGNCSTGKPRVRLHCQSRRKQGFSWDNFDMAWFMHPSQTKNLPNSSLAKAPLDHHLSSTKFYSACETLWLIGLSGSLSNHQMTRWSNAIDTSHLPSNPYGLLCFSLMG